MKVFAAALLAAISSATLITEKELAFVQHIAKYSLSYTTTEEYQYRAEIYYALDDDIVSLNKEI